MVLQDSVSDRLCHKALYQGFALFIDAGWKTILDFGLQRSPVSILDSIRIIFFQIALWLRPTLSPHLLTNPTPALEVKLVPGKGGSDSLVRVMARNLACPGYYGGGDLGSYGDLIGCLAKILRICPQ